jgi:hypothetical protein
MLATDSVSIVENSLALAQSRRQRTSQQGLFRYRTNITASTIGTTNMKAPVIAVTATSSLVMVISGKNGSGYSLP